MGDAKDGNQIPYYDQDLDEAFAGPSEYDQEDNESNDDNYWEESQALIEATMGGTTIPRNDQQIVSDYIQLGAVPGSVTQEQALSGEGITEPVGPPRSGIQSIEFASSEEDSRAVQSQPSGALDPGASFNPDGSPLAEETQLLSELQRVQRDIANRRLERKRRLEQQLHWPAGSFKQKSMRMQYGNRTWQL